MGKVEFPDGMSDADIVAVIKKQSVASAPNPTGSFVENMLSGIGQGMSSVARGMRQVAPGAPTTPAAFLTATPQQLQGVQQEPQKVQAQIDEAKRLDAPLMKTGGGIAGSMVGNVAAAAPALMVPGANTYIGSGLLGSAMGLLQPTATGESRALNTAVGGILGVASKFAGDKLVGALSRAVAPKISTGADITEEAVKAGYKLRPSEAGGGMITRGAEGLSGSARLAQEASVKNQAVTNALAQKAVGLPKDVPITPQALKGIRDQAGQAYQTIESMPKINWDHAFESGVKALAKQDAGGAISNPARPAIKELVKELDQPVFTGAGVVQDIKLLREMGHTNLSAASRAGGDTAKSTLGKAQLKGAELLEGLVERNLSNAGAPADAIQALKDARTLIAKAHTVENALDASGNVDARVLARLLDRGKPLSGELLTIAKVADRFPQSMRTITGTPPLTAFDLGVGALGAFADPTLMVLAGARPAIRAGLLSGPMQRGVASPSVVGPAAMGLLNQGMQSRIGQAGRRALPAVLPGVFANSE